MSQVIVTPPASEPVSVDEAMAWCRVDPYDDNARQLVAALITSARQIVENDTGRCLLPTTFRLSRDRFPHPAHGKFPLLADWEVRLPSAPLQSVTSITYVDELGVTQTLDPVNYVVDVDAQPGRIVKATNYSWPCTLRHHPQALQITYVAGYADVASVPQPLKDAIRCLVTYLYDNPADDGDGLPLAYCAMIGPFKTGQAW
jgi:uncharacterized phiE125 gp8 family phage protein